MQTPKNIQRGEPITARWLNSLIELVMRRIRGGKGITIKRTSAGIIISLAKRDTFQAAAVIEGADLVVFADTKNDLPTDVDDGVFGVLTGVDKRGYWRFDGEWICLTHTEP